VTRLPCGCGIAWLTTGGPQEPANTRAPPVFRRHSANERPGWLLCEAHRRGVAMAPHLPELRGHFEALWLRAQAGACLILCALALTACAERQTGPLPRGWSGPFLCHSGVAGADYHRDGVSMVCVSSGGQWQWRRILPRPSQPPRTAS